MHLPLDQSERREKNNKVLFISQLEYPVLTRSSKTFSLMTKTAQEEKTESALKVLKFFSAVLKPSWSFSSKHRINYKSESQINLLLISSFFLKIILHNSFSYCLKIVGETQTTKESCNKPSQAGHSSVILICVLYLCIMIHCQNKKLKCFRVTQFWQITSLRDCCTVL